MKILTGIGTADHHHDEFGVFVNHFIVDRWFQQMTILIDPLLEGKRTGKHGWLICSDEVSKRSAEEIDDYQQE
jgi:hypothetical protein